MSLSAQYRFAPGEFLRVGVEARDGQHRTVKGERMAKEPGLHGCMQRRFQWHEWDVLVEMYRDVFVLTAQKPANGSYLEMTQKVSRLLGPAAAAWWFMQTLREANS